MVRAIIAPKNSHKIMPSIHPVETVNIIMHDYHTVSLCSLQGFHVYKVTEGLPAHQVGVIDVGDRLLEVCIISHC